MPTYASGSHRTVFASKYYLVLSWQETAYNVSTNTSTVAWQLSVDATNGYMEASASKSWSVTVDGQTWTGSHSGLNVRYTTLQITSGTKTITHASDGSKTFNFSYSMGINVQFSSGWVYTVSGSSTGTLTTIPRATTPVFKNAAGTSVITSVAIGTDFRIDVSGRASTSFSHKITYSFGNLNNGSSPVEISAGASNQYLSWNGNSWTPSAANLGEQIPNATSGVCTVTCKTYNGTTLVGTTAATIAFSVPASWKPTLSGVTLKPSRNVFGTSSSPVFVNLVDAVDMTASAAGSNGSTIRGVTVTFQGTSYSATYDSSASKWKATTNIGTSAGSNTVTVVATDSRGASSATSSSSLTFQAYTLPENTLTVGRCDANGNASESGDYMTVTIQSKVSSVKPSSSELNYRTVVLKYTISGETEQTETIVSQSSTSLEGNAVTATPIPVPNNKTCEVIAIVSDKANSTTRLTNLSVGYCTLDFLDGGRGINIGGTAANEYLVSNMPIRLGAKIERKNLLKIPYHSSDKTEAGITWTVNDDGSIKANGTATSNAYFYLTGTNNPLPLNGQNVRYTLVTDAAGGEVPSGVGYYIDFTNSGGSSSLSRIGPGAIPFERTYDTVTNIRLRINSGTTVSNLTLYPMVMDTGITDTTWEPYIPDIPEVQNDYNTKISSITTDLSSAESAITSVRTKQNKNLFRVTTQTTTINLSGYSTAGSSSGVYLVLLRPWTVSLKSGAVYIVSFITNDYGAATCIEPSTGTTLSISGATVTITFPDSAGGMVAILGAPII